jgi:hypothetical protein
MVLRGLDVISWHAGMGGGGVACCVFRVASCVVLLLMRSCTMLCIVDNRACLVHMRECCVHTRVELMRAGVE